MHITENIILSTLICIFTESIQYIQYIHSTENILQGTIKELLHYLKKILIKILCSTYLIVKCIRQSTFA